MKATVYRISGAVLSSNYIQFPKATSQSLGLTGRFIYLLFRPLPTKYFSIHIEVATSSGLAVRISLSNLFKEFKCTSTWLQFPFSHFKPVSEKSDKIEVIDKGKRNDGPSVGVPRWTLLVFDFRATLTRHLNTKFAYVKNIKLCANLLVKGVFSSNTEYSPVIDEEMLQTGLQPLPRDMRFPLARLENFVEVYDFIRFPFESGARRGFDCVKLGGPGKGAGGQSTVGLVSVEGDSGEGVRGRRLKNHRGGEPRKTRVRNVFNIMKSVTVCVYIVE